MTEELEINVALPNEVIVHLRTVMMIAERASQYEADVSIGAGGSEVNGKDVMDLLTLLGAGHREMTIRAEGEDAPGALEGLRTLVETGLFED